MSLNEHIARLALQTFNALPQKCKPRSLANGQKEWTPMSAVVLSKPVPASALTTDVELKIVSLATGTKSLPVSALPKCQGLILHDCHAEILALRGFNHWLLCEIESILRNDMTSSAWLQLDSSSNKSRVAQPSFSMYPGIQIHLFSTEAPCGDASMELLMASAQAAGFDTSPWQLLPAEHSDNQDSDVGALPAGRGYFSNLGVLRRKPARADAEISMSKSCTDKIMLKQFISLLQFPADLFVKPTSEAFLKTLIVYEDQYNKTGYDRAFSAGGRLRSLAQEGVLSVGKGPRFFNIECLPAEFQRFEFEKLRMPGAKNKVTNLSALRLDLGSGYRGREHIEVLVNGVRQGFKQFEERIGKGSALCRYNLLHRALKICRMLEDRGYTPPLPINAELRMYSDLKVHSRSGQRWSVKDTVLSELGGWPVKEFEDDFEMSNVRPD